MEESGSKKLSTKKEVESLIKYLFENPPKELVIVASSFDKWKDRINHLLAQNVVSH